MSKVDTKHSDYQKWLPVWARCRIAAEGQRAVHQADTALLPKLTGQTPEEYQSFKSRALFYPATGRTVEGLTGLIFRRPPVVTAPESATPIIEDVDLANTPILTFCEKVVDELIKVGRVGLLADYPRNDGEKTMADQMVSGARPYVVAYKAEDIINWRIERINNRLQLTMVVLSETYDEVDGFETTTHQQYRVLRLTPLATSTEATMADAPVAPGYVYTTEVWRKPTGGADFVLSSDPVAPLLNGQPLPSIPFIVCGPLGVTTDMAKPPIEDLADVNLSHYRTTADYEHGLHFTGLPTPVVTGHRFETNEVFALGSTQIKAFPNPDSKAFFLEFEGEGLKQLAARLAEKEEMMVALGARLLAKEKRAAEAAETAAIHRAGENGVLASLANSASSAISMVMTWCVMWSSPTSEPVVVQLNTDFMPAGLNAGRLTALVKAWQSGAMSWETLYDNLQRGEIARTGVDAETERDLIDMEAPRALSADPSNPPVDNAPDGGEPMDPPEDPPSPDGNDQ